MQKYLSCLGLAWNLKFQNSLFPLIMLWEAELSWGQNTGLGVRGLLPMNVSKCSELHRWKVHQEVALSPFLPQQKNHLHIQCNALFWEHHFSLMQILDWSGPWRQSTSHSVNERAESALESKPGTLTKAGTLLQWEREMGMTRAVWMWLFVLLLYLVGMMGAPLFLRKKKPHSQFSSCFLSPKIGF